MEFGPVTLTWLVGGLASGVCAIPLLLLFVKSKARETPVPERGSKP